MGEKGNVESVAPARSVASNLGLGNATASATAGQQGLQGIANVAPSAPQGSDGGGLVGDALDRAKDAALNASGDVFSAGVGGFVGGKREGADADDEDDETK